MNHDWSAWGPLARRYQDERPRRMLSLDGGGIRGLLTCHVLEALEERLREHYASGWPDPGAFRLCQFFDYIGGTSTGAILATGLARGMSAKDLREFYEAFGREAFEKRPWWQKYKSLYQDGALAKKLREVFGESTTLEPEHLETLLLVVTRNQSTDSAWPVSSNPSAKYNAINRNDCNLRLPLWQLVRASTAAPVYFPPETVTLGSQKFVFVDGGTTPFNNPAFLMTRMATEPRYRLNWKRSEQDLLVVSLGTGSYAVPGTSSEDGDTNVVAAALNTVSAVMNQAQVQQDVACRTIGRCTHGGHLDGEIEDLIPVDDVASENPQRTPLSTDLRRAFLYARYEAELEGDWLQANGLGDIDPESVRSLDSVDGMPDLARIGKKLGEAISLEHFGSFIDVPLWEG